MNVFLLCSLERSSGPVVRCWRPNLIHITEHCNTIGPRCYFFKNTSFLRSSNRLYFFGSFLYSINIWRLRDLSIHLIMQVPTHALCVYVWERAFKSSHYAFRLGHLFLASSRQSSVGNCVAQQRRAACVPFCLAASVLFGPRFERGSWRRKRALFPPGRFLCKKPPWDDAPGLIPGCCPAGASSMVGRNSPSASSAPRVPPVAHRSTLLVFAQNDCYLGNPPASRGRDLLQRAGLVWPRLRPESARGSLGPPRSASVAVGTNRIFSILSTPILFSNPVCSKWRGPLQRAQPP